MFERCTEPTRRAIYFAHVLTVISEGPKITSVELLAGLLFGDDSRAQSIFQLRERFPFYRGCPCKFETLPKPQQAPPLTGYCKMILAWAEREAGWMGDYWIDTEHLLLGILRVPQSTAAQYLAKTGLTLDVARKTILDHRPSRPDCGPVPRWWGIKNRLFRMALLGQTP
jgi:ATP-dependent Clp protease ATP-binding subunit ClpA